MKIPLTFRYAPHPIGGKLFLRRMDCGRVTKKLNVEHRTSNIECLMVKDEETE
jgi:hypothetical protein